jgi:hypothetical protein
MIAPSALPHPPLRRLCLALRSRPQRGDLFELARARVFEPLRLEPQCDALHSDALGDLAVGLPAAVGLVPLAHTGIARLARRRRRTVRLFAAAESAAAAAAAAALRDPVVVVVANIGARAIVGVIDVADEVKLVARGRVVHGARPRARPRAGPHPGAAGRRVQQSASGHGNDGNGFSLLFDYFLFF